MILPLFRRSPQADTISALYGTIVAQARLPVFYRDYSVPDSIDGRFELVVVHLFLLLRRLETEGRTGQMMGQQVFDLFCRDMDQNLREIGTGDLKVPTEMRRLGAAYYGRAKAYEAALAAAGPDGLVSAIGRNVLGRESGELAAAGQLANYMREAAAGLAGQDLAAFNRGNLRFPEPRRLDQD
jgi:cytochrome b pre-mRNA-processing protein 3